MRPAHRDQVMMTTLQQDPAEGSRETVERELRRQNGRRKSRLPEVGPDEVLRLLGETSPARIAAILALEPSLSELELAAQWGQGNADISGQAGHPLAGKAAAIVDIVRPDWEELDEDR